MCAAELSQWPTSEWENQRPSPPGLLWLRRRLHVGIAVGAAQRRLRRGCWRQQHRR